MDRATARRLALMLGLYGMVVVVWAYVATDNGLGWLRERSLWLLAGAFAVLVWILLRAAAQRDRSE